MESVRSQYLEFHLNTSESKNTPWFVGKKKKKLADEPLGPDRIKELCSKVQIKTFNNPLFN